MSDQLAVGLVDNLHQQIVIDVVGDAGLRGRGVRLGPLPAVPGIRFPLRQRAHQVQIRVPVTSVFHGRPSVVPPRRIAGHHVDTAISSHRVEVPVATPHQIEITLLVPGGISRVSRLSVSPAIGINFSTLTRASHHCYFYAVQACNSVRGMKSGVCGFVWKMRERTMGIDFIQWLRVVG